MRRCFLLPPPLSQNLQTGQSPEVFSKASRPKDKRAWRIHPKPGTGTQRAVGNKCFTEGCIGKNPPLPGQIFRQWLCRLSRNTTLVKVPVRLHREGPSHTDPPVLQASCITPPCCNGKKKRMLALSCQNHYFWNPNPRSSGDRMPLQQGAGRWKSIRRCAA